MPFHFTVNHIFVDHIVSHIFLCISPVPTVYADINVVMNPKNASIHKSVPVILSDNTICEGKAGQLEQNADYTAVMWDWVIEESSPL